MAVTPTATIPLDVQYTNEPGLTWYIDQSSKQIQGYCDGYEAIKQAVDIILHTDRFKWQIYDPSSGVDYSGLIGQDGGYVAAELQRRIREALMMDTRVLGISNFIYSLSGDSLTVEFTVNTVFGAVPESLEVAL